MRIPVRTFIGVAIAAITIAMLALQRDPHPASEHDEAIASARRDAGDTIAALNRRLAAGELRLTHHVRRGYLDEVLRALAIPRDSQALVYSQTSRQRAQIDDSTPRAIYFNDRAYVGWVPGARDLEIAITDGVGAGARFYTLDQSAMSAATPRFEAGARCFECHTLPAIGGLQGLLMRRLVPGARHPGRHLPPVVTTDDMDDTTPFAERWNGWFVSGVSLPPVHQGEPVPALDRETYPAATSDVIGLLVLGHQVEMTNRFLRLADAWASAGADTLVETRGQRLIDVVNYMLFVDEAPLPRPLRGDSSFATTFVAAGRRDGAGRSLRDFDLDRRLFRYRCSFMIEAPVFDALPAEARSAVYRRLSAVLVSGDGPVADWTADERRAVIDILRATRSDLPSDFGR